MPALDQTRILVVPHIAAANHACCPNGVVVEAAAHRGSATHRAA